MSTPETTISDEELATAAYDAVTGHGWPTFADAPDDLRIQYLRMARAVRAALTPPVEPLAPGETVTVPTDSDHYARMMLALDGSGRLVCYITNYEDPDRDVPFAECYASLDTAGVRELRDTCDRWLVGGQGE